MNEDHMNESVVATLEGDLRDATEELFGAYDISVTYTDGGPPSSSHDGPTIVAVIGFASQEIRGALAIVATPGTIHQWQPGLDTSDPGGAEDAIGEFSNMLLGRLKYKLLQRGVTLLMATPLTASGRRMTLRPPAGLVSRWHRFESASGAIAVRLDATFDAGFSFDRESTKLPAAAAGDMMLF